MAAARTSFLVVISGGVGCGDLSCDDRLMMISACVFVCGGVVGVVCCLRTQECALFNTF